MLRRMGSDCEGKGREPHYHPVEGVTASFLAGACVVRVEQGVEEAFSVVTGRRSCVKVGGGGLRRDVVKEVRDVVAHAARQFQPNR